MAELHYPTLLTDGVVRLRPWADGDVTCVEQAATDPRILEVASVPAHSTRAACLAFIRRQHERLTSGKAVSLAVADAGTDEALGLVILASREQPGVAGLGYWIVPGARRRGLARRAVGLMATWGLTGFARVEAWVEPANTTSQRVLAGNGFAREGLLRSFLVIGGHRADVFVYSRISG